MYLICHVTWQDHMTERSCDPVKFAGNWYCGSGDMFLICHAVSYDHVIRGSCGLWILALGFGGHRHHVMEKQWLWFLARSCKTT